MQADSSPSKGTARGHIGSRKQESSRGKQSNGRVTTGVLLAGEELVQRVCATYEQRKRDVKYQELDQTLEQELEVVAPFVGPFALGRIAQEGAGYWKEKLES